MAKRRLFNKDSALEEQRSVPFLRPFEWVATALTSFRERPLPSSYSPTAQPTFDLFSSSRLREFQVERIVGGLGSIEVFSPRIATDKYRLYVSVSCVHDDGVDHQMLFGRAVPDPTLGFPFVVFGTSASLITAEETLAFQNVLIPPDNRMEVVASLPSSMGAGARMTMTGLFIEFDVGEPSAGCIGGG